MQDLKIILNIFYEPNNALKKFIENTSFIYFPINGGSQLIKNDTWAKQYLNPDNTGDNISNLNPTFNELTSIYWFWKNYPYLNRLKYIGFNHYRRFFKANDFIDYENYDIICAKPVKALVSLYAQYCLYHFKEDIDLLLNTLYTVCDKNEVDQYFHQKTFYAMCNMFIMKKELFEEYCEFMFKILFQIKDKINLDLNSKQFLKQFQMIRDNRENYQRRAIAFLSERLTSFWIYQKIKQNLKVKQIDVIFFKTM